MSKLVRDRIPEIIRASGREPRTHVADEPEFKRALLDKIVEEATEARAAVLETHDEANQRAELISELSDVLEVMDALMRCFGIRARTLAIFQDEKRERRGGFQERIILDE